MEEMIERFHHLLKPIRDLEQNWSIDLAEELTQALQSLSEQMISFGQNGDKIIDFSKAALIIQGSAHVYSKKVDYLYKTVYDMKDWMEKLWEVEKKSRSGRVRNEGDHPDLHIEEDEDDELDFSYIKEDDTWLDEAQIQDQIDGSVLLPPKPMKLTDSLNLKIPLKSMKGDIIGYMNEFLINTTDIEALLTGSDSMPKPSKPQCDDIDMGAPVDTGAPADVDMNDTYEAVTDDYVEPADNVNDMPASNKDGNSSCQTVTPVRSDRMTRQLRPRHVTTQKKQPEVLVDPWSQILDPHTAAGRATKSLKPGNCRLLPPSLRKGTKRRQNGKRAAEEKPDDIATFCNKEYNPSVTNTGSNLLYPEFKTLFSDILKKRNEEFRKIKKARLPSCSGDEDIADADRADYDDDDCGNLHDDTNNGDDDGVPFSRLQDPGDVPSYKEGSDDLPEGYSQYLAEVVKREYEELAAHNDKLSEIDKRVKAWEVTVKGAIDTAETRPSFDMHHYSDTIFSSFSGDEPRLPFDRILEGKPKFEAFRTFVSALILANHGNIDIVQDQKKVELSLLHKTTLSEVIDGGETLM